MPSKTEDASTQTAHKLEHEYPSHSFTNFYYYKSVDQQICFKSWVVDQHLP